MDAQLTVRVPADLHREVTQLAKQLRLKRSDVVRMALQKFTESFKKDEDDLPYDRVKHLIGSVSSGVTNLGSDHRRHLIEKFRKDA